VPLTKKAVLIDKDSRHLGRRLDRIVQSLTDMLPRAQVLGLFDHGCVQLNGATSAFPGQKAALGDNIEVRYDARQIYHPRNKPRQNLGFEIVHEDRHLIVVNKPPELLTVPTIRGETNTLVAKVSEYVRHVSGGQQVFTAHRLDRGVSGLLVMGKTQQISERLRDQFAAHKPEREYAALVAGVLKKDKGTFNTLLATDKDLTRFSTDDEDIGQRAITHYEVLRRLRGFTYVKVWLETGRRNQIRVHFSEEGHPVLGDPRYEPELAAHSRWPYKRLALHARRLAFEHPISREQLRFESPLPAEMERLLTQ
jgi:23S rRNA pseudouridine1911/1915/1917 synthase